MRWHERTWLSLRSAGSFALLLAFVVPGSIRAGCDLQSTPEAAPTPHLICALPDVVTPDMYIDLVGQYLGANDPQGVRVVFTQAEHQYSTPVLGGSYTHQAGSRQSVALVVPTGLVPSTCRVSLEYGGQRSAPLELKVADVVSPPTLKMQRKQVRQPGEVLFLSGTGFSTTNEVELTDLLGGIHTIKGPWGGGSSADSFPLFLPKELPAGEVTVRVVEQRSPNPRSNSVTIWVTHGPMLYTVYGMTSVAPGQWLDLEAQDLRAIQLADRVEIGFKQNDRLVVVSPLDPKLLRVQVPVELSPGRVFIQGRTWFAGIASPWSEPERYRLSDTPADNRVESLTVMPQRAEIQVWQGGRLFRTLDIQDPLNYQLPLPEDLADGDVVFMTRMWRGGLPTEWVRRPWRKFPKVGDPRYAIGSWGERKDIRPDSPDRMVAYAGEYLYIGGTYPVGSTEKLVAEFKREGQSIRRGLTFHSDFRSLKVQIPETVGSGEWDLILHDLGGNPSYTLPIKLIIK